MGQDVASLVLKGGGEFSRRQRLENLLRNKESLAKRADHGY